MWTILLGYVLPFIINYIVVRNYYKESNEGAEIEGLLAVVLPIANLIMAILIIICSIPTQEVMDRFLC